jgi:O-antigen ligase
MRSALGILIYAVVLLALVFFGREKRARSSVALWLPLIWVFITSSRFVSEWLNPSPAAVTPESYLEGSPLDRNVFSVLIFLALIVLASRASRVFELLSQNKLVLLFFLYCGLSILWSDFRFIALKRFIKALGDLAMVTVVLTEADYLTAIKRLLARFAILFVPLSLLFVKYFPDLGRQYNRWTWAPEYVGIATTKNMLGLGCLVVATACIWRLTSLAASHRSSSDASVISERSRQLLVYGVLLLMALWLLSMANSVTSMLCLAAAAVVVVITKSVSWTQQRWKLHILVLLLISVPAGAIWFDLGSDAIVALGRDASLTGRTAIWQQIPKLVNHSFLGTGFESFWLGKRLEAVWDVLGELNEAHNGYLEVYLNLGWAGVILLAAIIVAGYRNIMHKLETNPLIGRLCLGYFVAALIFSVSEAGFRMQTSIWILFLLSVMRVPDEPTPQKSSPSEAEEAPHEPAVPEPISSV